MARFICAISIQIQRKMLTAEQEKQNKSGGRVGRRERNERSASERSHHFAFSHWHGHGQTARMRRSPNDLISLAQHGKINPDEAEAEAKAHGWKPFKHEPALPRFDPSQEARWSLPMALAWIAWRDLKLVREQHAGFRSECVHWVFGEWSRPGQPGAKFDRHRGWLLKPWPPTSAQRLRLFQHVVNSLGEMPSTKQMSIADAERELWAALSVGHLAAAALNSEQRAVEIPQREWGYLKLFEEQESDVLKYDALDPSPAFTVITFDRMDLMTLWPKLATAVVELKADGFVETSMIEPVARSGDAGYVPLCSALHWIMTKGGSHRVRMNDQGVWKAARDELIALIQEGEIELVGTPRPGALAERIPGRSLAFIKILHPVESTLEDILVNAPPHIACAIYLDKNDWTADLGDRLYLAGRPGPAWTHLTVRKSQVLRHWPRPASQAKPEQACREWLIEQVRRSPEHRPKSKSEFLAEAKAKFRGLKDRQFERCWSAAIAETGVTGWSKPGPTKE